MTDLVKLKAKYIGPFSSVSVPGIITMLQPKYVERNEEVTFTVRRGYPIGGDWEIIEGKKEYEAGLAELAAETAKAKEARLARKKAFAKEVRDKIAGKVAGNAISKEAPVEESTNQAKPKTKEKK